MLIYSTCPIRSSNNEQLLSSLPSDFIFMSQAFLALNVNAKRKSLHSDMSV